MANKGIDDETLSSLVGEMPDWKKIEALIRRKFPGSNAPPPVPTLYWPCSSSDYVAYNERKEKMEIYSDELKALPREELLDLWQQECVILNMERKQREDSLFLISPAQVQIQVGNMRPS